MLIYIGTTNDTNGNPRRGWIRTDNEGQALEWIEEGYEGRGAIAGYSDAVTMKITVAPAEFKRLKFNAQGAKK
jgi:hypothetical protein